MKRKRYRQGRWLPLLLMLLLGLLALPVSGTWVRAKQSSARTTSLDATVYLTTATLLPLFQSRINQQVPGTVNSVIGNMLSKQSKANQSWLQLMANTLIKPSATVTQLTPQQDGLATTLSLSLYPGDPKPTITKMLVKFSMLDSSTVQVSADSLDGSPALVSGPLTKFQMPIGQLNSVAAAPNCGDAALAANLQFPVSFDDPQAPPTPQARTGTSSAADTALLTTMPQGAQRLPQTHTAMDAVPMQTVMQQKPQDNLAAYVAVPLSSLSALATGVGTLAISKTLKAQNLRLSVQNNSLAITSDISLWNTGVTVASATSYLQPAVEGGNLVFHVTKTTLTVIVFTFSDNTYNQQIEQLLNGKLGSALSGKFNATDVALGANSHIPCAPSDGLILTGTANIS